MRSYYLFRGVQQIKGSLYIYNNDYEFTLFYYLNTIWNVSDATARNSHLSLDASNMIARYGSISIFFCFSGLNGALYWSTYMKVIYSTGWVARDSTLSE